MNMTCSLWHYVAAPLRKSTAYRAGRGFLQVTGSLAQPSGFIVRVPEATPRRLIEPSNRGTSVAT